MAPISKQQDGSESPSPALEPDIMELLTRILYRLDEIESMLEDVEGKLSDLELPYQGTCDD